jgi:hypothetical protein
MKYIDSSPSVAFLHLSLVCSVYRPILISITVLPSIYHHIIKRKNDSCVQTHTHTLIHVKHFLAYPEGT